MTIHGESGKTYDVTGSGQGNLNTVLGAIGTAGTLFGNGMFGGLFGNGNNSRGATCSENEFITRYDAEQQHIIAAKDSEIALLKADQATDKKLVDVYAALKVSENNLRDRVDILDRELAAKITAEREARLVAEGQQQVFNQQLIGTTSTMASQIAQLQSTLGEITTNVVPANKVCQTGCCGCN